MQQKKTAKVYGNYIYLDKEERETFTTRNLDFIITQVQGFKTELITVANNAVDVGGHNKIDLSHFNHPVKSIFWGFGASVKTLRMTALPS